jgi:hypothetical protein
MPPVIRAYSFGETKEIVNGQIVQDKSVKTEYNGKLLHVDKQDNNKFTHYILKGKELKHLLKKKTSKLGLLERLNADYMGHKTKRNKHTMKRRSIKKGSMRRNKRVNKHIKKRY